MQDTPETNAAENARRAGGGGGGGGGGTGGGGGNNSGAGGSGGNNANSTGQDPPQLQRTATPLSPIGISRTCLNERPPASVVTISFDREGHTRIRTSGMSNKGAVDLSIELLELLLQLLRKYAKISKRSMAEALDRVRLSRSLCLALSLSRSISCVAYWRTHALRPPIGWPRSTVCDVSEPHSRVALPARPA